EFKRLFAAFKNDYKQQKNIIAAKELRIKKMLEDLNKQSFVLDPKKKKQREEKFRQEKVDFERYVQDKNAEFARKEKELTERVLKQMIEVIRQIGKEKNFTMIVEEKVVLYHDSGHDLTNLAIKQYDRIHK
ncbi:MAG: OmpH family outer membrane protein, partial [Nitrospinaceae bacterium]|nr:OmpH family outer membrane protein [Nitrospinaceae bacterium]NIS24518.1 OmpH family outer membrane protein [candidate division KSB1 bacterium]NIR54953.1 OmpH family outer membrane protein [Nitrospinaceae bacterium]NIT82195.1 OmpH family outer membrane protein [Nitrospinaceae bacterium]NIU44439.1 OmpH family outer membrane protein [Nitrospinaceae bacterium]